MNMTEGEICRQYRSAKDRASQLQILADLNCVPRLEIIKILMHNGEQVRLPLAAKGKKRTTELTDEEYTAALFRRLDVLDREISKREREYREIVAVMGGMKKCTETAKNVTEPSQRWQIDKQEYQNIRIRKP